MFWTGSKQFVYGAATLAGLVVLVVGLIAFFGGIGQLPAIAPAPTPTPLPGEDLVGVWSRADEGLYLQFDLDGTFRVATAISFLETAPSDLGQFRLDGTSLTYISSSESPSCADQIGSYHVELTEGDQLEFTTQEDPCQIRDYVSTAALWDRISQDDLPLGAYITTITQEDLLARDDLSSKARSILLGEWEMTLTEGNGYSHGEVTESGRLVVAEKGHYTLTRDQIVFTAEGGAYACTGSPEVKSGTYEWAFDGKTLTLTTVEDPCPERNTVNSTHPWSRQD